MSDYKDELSIVIMRSHQQYTKEQFQNLVINEFEKVERDFGKTHKDIIVSFVLDNSHCYYPGDTEDPALKFEGVRK